MTTLGSNYKAFHKRICYDIPIIVLLHFKQYTEQNERSYKLTAYKVQTE
jgi:hypothetical protein